MGKLFKISREGGGEVFQVFRKIYTPGSMENLLSDNLPLPHSSRILLCLSLSFTSNKLLNSVTIRSWCIAFINLNSYEILLSINYACLHAYVISIWNCLAECLIKTVHFAAKKSEVRGKNTGSVTKLQKIKEIKENNYLSDYWREVKFRLYLWVCPHKMYDLSKSD